MKHPKIGIRPTIDGRWGGVRESLEEQTMGMAKRAAKLIEDNLRYPDGEKVEVVISPTTIGGGAEAAVCEEYFTNQNVIGTLTVTPCWCYGTETMDLNPNTIKAVWGFNFLHSQSTELKFRIRMMKVSLLTLQRRFWTLQEVPYL